MFHALLGLGITLSLMIGMFGALFIGRGLGRRRLAQSSTEEAGETGTGALDGVVFALLGLLLAFTYSSASSRLDERRQLIVSEANAIGTAYLRIDLLPAEAQPELKGLFYLYTRSRLDTYQRLPDVEAAKESFDQSMLLQTKIWSTAMKAGASMQDPAPLLLVTPALNEMFDIATSRVAAFRMHQPAVVFVMLLGLALACAFLAGLNSAKVGADALHSAVFVTAVTAAVFVILDMEFPRVGFIRVDDFDSIIEAVLAGMK
ncbi:MAG: DUF4239 domain-containing protein [Thermoanaerobaculia bacterium]|nr:DUF4239 domain-containing protein [Thermoanaerobaculia bacterium]